MRDFKNPQREVFPLFGTFKFKSGVFGAGALTGGPYRYGALHGLGGLTISGFPNIRFPPFGVKPLGEGYTNI